MRAAEIMKRAHEIRSEASRIWGGRPGDYSLSIALEMAWKGERISARDSLERAKEIINADSDWSAKMWEKNGFRRLYITSSRGASVGYLEDRDGLEFHKGSGKGQVRFAGFWKELRAAGLNVA